MESHVGRGLEKIDQQAANPYKRIITDKFPLVHSSSPSLSNASDLPRRKLVLVTPSPAETSESVSHAVSLEGQLCGAGGRIASYLRGKVH